MSDYANCTLPPDAVNDVLAKQASMLREEIQQDLAYSEPYSNTINGRTINMSNRGETIRSLTANRVSPAWSRVAPDFQPYTDSCNSIPSSDEIGQTEFNSVMESRDGRGPTICVREAIHTVMNSLRTTADSLKQAIRELKGYDIRNKYFELSGLKFVARSGNNLDTILTGSRNAVSTAFHPELPNATVSLQTLIAIADKMQSVHGVERFGSGMDSHYLVVAGNELIERIRNDSTVEKAILSQTEGGLADGNNSIKMFPWLDIQHRGLRFGQDFQPMRFNNLDGSGNPVLIEPEVSVSSDHGKNSVTNPDWANAKYEIAFMVGKDAFEYLTLQSFTGEGAWQYGPQFTMGDLVWHNVKDNQCNFKGDLGFHWYEIVRAVNPIKPHAITTIAYQRCPADLGLEPCEEVGLSS